MKTNALAAAIVVVLVAGTSYTVLTTGAAPRAASSVTTSSIVALNTTAIIVTSTALYNTTATYTQNATSIYTYTTATTATQTSQVYATATTVLTETVAAIAPTSACSLSSTQVTAYPVSIAAFVFTDAYGTTIGNVAAGQRFFVIVVLADSDPAGSGMAVFGLHSSYMGGTQYSDFGGWVRGGETELYVLTVGGAVLLAGSYALTTTLTEGQTSSTVVEQVSCSFSVA